METITLKFKASGQKLTADSCPQNYASNTVNYIQAEFDLDDNWKSFDSVRAVWHNDFACISTVLDGNGKCTVPHEVLENLAETQVNLVGSIIDGTELTDRLTTYPIRAAIIDAEAHICGTETAEVTPSQFEQYIAIVEQIVGTVKDIDHTELTDDYCLIIYYSDGTNSGKLGPIRGATGATGNGIASAVLNDDYTLTLNYTNGEHDTVGPIRGAQGETGNGIESIYLTETHGAVKTYTILFTDGTTTTFDVTDGEVTRAELESVLPTDTASGAIASFPDGSDLFDYLSCVVNIEPVQDLHGYDKPWVGGSHYNQWDEQWEVGSYGSDGLPVASIDRIRTKNRIEVLPSTAYYFKNGGTGNLIIFWYDADDVVISFEGTNNAVKTSPSNAKYLRFRTNNYGTTYGNDIAINYPSSVTTYSPWQNLCPITGWTGCEVSVAGVNVWDEEWELGVYASADGQPYASSSNIRSKSSNYISVQPNTTYYFNTAGKLMEVYRYGANKNYIDKVNVTDNTISFDSNTYFIRFDMASAYGTTYGNNISINYPSTDTTYHAYNGTTYPVSWQTEAGTVYGGTVDVVTGVLTVDRKLTTISSWDGTFGSMANGYCVYKSLSDRRNSEDTICNMFKRSGYSVDNMPLGTYQGGSGGYSTWSFILPPTITSLEEAQTWLSNLSTPLVLTEALETPTTYQLTGQQIACLLGQNNVWANCGDTSVTYKADVQRWVEKKLGA